MNRNSRRLAKRSANKTSKSHSTATDPTIARALATAKDLLAKGRNADAIDICLRILQVEDHNAEARFTLASSYEMSGQLHEARASYKSILDATPKFLPALVNYAAVCAELSLYKESIQRYREALALDGSIDVVHRNLAAVYKTLKQFGPALKSCKAGLGSQPTIQGLCELADIHEQSGQIDDAISTFEKAIGLTSIKAPYYIMLARLEMVRNNKHAAKDYLDRCLNADPNYGYAHLMKAKHFSTSGSLDELQHTIIEAIAATTGRMTADYSAPLHFALGHLEDTQSNYQAAFNAYKVANDNLASQQPSKDVDSTVTQALEIADAYTGADDHAVGNEQHAKESRPTFIVGLPRSGTTLIEQMLAQHPNVIVLGELELMPTVYDIHVAADSKNLNIARQFYLDAYPSMDSSITCVVDKSISSYQYANFIASMFPNARFIFCFRHPMAVLWSAFREYFKAGASTYTYNIERIVEHIKLFYRISETFKAGRIDIYYETLIHEPEQTCRAITTYLEIPWDSAMLRFNESKQPVRTASLAQVRQPLYKSSAEHWRNYQPYLQPAYDELAPLINSYKEEIG